MIAKEPLEGNIYMWKSKKLVALEKDKSLVAQLKDTIAIIDVSIKKTETSLIGSKLHLEEWKKNVKMAEKALRKDIQERSIFEQLLEQARSYHKDYVNIVDREEEAIVNLQAERKSIADAYADLTRNDEIVALQKAMKSRLKDIDSVKNSLGTGDSALVTIVPIANTIDEQKTRQLIYTAQAAIKLAEEMKGI